MLSAACLSHKGGVGKSTLARLIATVYARAEWSVKIADFHIKQTTSVDWVSRRLASGVEPRIAAEAFSQVRQVLKGSADVDLLIFDGRPESDSVTLEIAKFATLVVVPVGVTLDDLLPQIRFANEMRERGVDRTKILFVINKSANSDVAINYARTLIFQSGYGCAQNDIPTRTAYNMAQNLGKSIYETTFPSLNERAEAVAQEVVSRLAGLSSNVEKACSIVEFYPPPKKAEAKLSAGFVTQLGVDRAAGNMSKPDTAALRDLSFKVPAELHRDFKGLANEHGISMRDLLEHLLDDYCCQHGPQLRETVPTAARRADRLRDAIR